MIHVPKSSEVLMVCKFISVLTGNSNAHFPAMMLAHWVYLFIIHISFGLKLKLRSLSQDIAFKTFQSVFSELLDN
jgi:hypothetical protein